MAFRAAWWMASSPRPGAFSPCRRKKSGRSPSRTRPALAAILRWAARISIPSKRGRGPRPTLARLHYPPQKGRITSARIGAGAHTDFGCLTMLAQDPVGGLQARNSAGAWVDAPYVPDSFVLNIGDMMERWTNGVFT